MVSQETASECGARRELGALSATSVRWRSLVWPAIAGFLFGYVVLHPVSMVIFQWLDPRCAAVPVGEADAFWGPLVHSFQISMLPMGLVFGVIGALTAVFYGCHRLMLTAQRDRLAEELTRNERLREELASQAETLKRNNEELIRLELANRRTSQFMAHDFKSALGCVAGFAGQLLQHPRLREDTEVTDVLTCIRRQAYRVMGSVMDLLEFARVRERGEPRMQPVSVSELLEEVVGDFSLPMHTEHISLGEKHGCCPDLTADPKLLRRVLCNLVSNAVKHNGRGTHVSLDAQMNELRTEILFSCSDDGAGIPPEVLPVIFTEFATTKHTSGESTGLGLAFCKAIVKAHGGRIWCESAPQQGARFYFTIPLRKESSDAR